MWQIDFGNYEECLGIFSLSATDTIVFLLYNTT